MLKIAQTKLISFLSGYNFLFYFQKLTPELAAIFSVLI